MTDPAIGATMSAVFQLDWGRTQRRGYPEAVFCQGKTAEQVAGIAAEAGEHPELVTLFTRADETHAAAVHAVLPDAAWDRPASMLAWPPAIPVPSGGPVAVVAAGTSDLGVAREAYLTARYLGREAELLVDMGVAGLHRLLGQAELLHRARCIVVVAGMDGALPSVVAGLVSAPVIAVPTSVGYGAAFGGLAALLAMLNACAPGVAVVNIDNGYGAGHLAAQIAAPLTGQAPGSPEAARRT
jgi:NCAIR mutase (PurE)-related protein